ncbi:MAG: transcriptional repressor LexA [Candidatus Thiodiazotropha lotti]|uniref:transcriptional repressor LexA n=1 Tax=Candidatus Thiodiazotropha endoloripes TaxID=1818881 RepID=UPI00083DA4C8|nr:transcriptional repressor LexA [Candidatus Thiodiazotropha endoloripes]MCG7900148.1 transcriptional repressor LexA [Candidatus Thiodiazotropha weberae]MCG7990661.1 transcriptional repressor LexA [Candidatus Thiodiazotropha lotti]MCG7901301.1 transcriptional repressor LexA [Candidatus Thiodiazotropha weberae]MCG7999474.1 transcriptional repressor LexA [Candidatus Thiodiazotropha lotti]MCW4182315.1 transcriptional repressor LexA [Candidatus Thiodiazotropha weberae]
MMRLTRRQQEIYDILRSDAEIMQQPPTYDELCQRLGLSSRGSLHKHIQALVVAGLVEPMAGKQRGIRLVSTDQPEQGIPMLGRIAAGRPIEAVEQTESISVPDPMTGGNPRYALQVSGDSMIDEGIFDGDYVVIEQSAAADNGDIVVALIDQQETTLKRLEQKPGKIILHPANTAMSAMVYKPDQIQIQGILRGLIRYY